MVFTFLRDDMPEMEEEFVKFRDWWNDGVKKGNLVIGDGKNT